MIQKFVGLILGLTIVWGCFSAYGQTAIETDSLLREAKVRDQTIREQFAQLTRRASEQGLTSLNASLADSLVSLSEQMQAIDRENLKLVSKLLRNGLPEQLKPESYHTIWLLVDHAELEEQKHFLPFLAEAVKKGLISGNEWAVLTDRIKMYEGQPQTYGTQSYTFSRDGQQVVYIWPVADPSDLNRLRREIGSDPIEEYVRQLKQEIGMEVIYDPALTVEDMQRMQ